MFGLREGLLECCNPSSLGEPEFLAHDPRYVSARASANLVESASGQLKLFFEAWRSDRHEHVRAVVVAHHGECEHSGWFNGVAVRLAGIGCQTFALDVQGFGQSDGARGYFEHFEDLVLDYVEFCKLKWEEVCEAQATALRPARPASLVLMGKGFGALVVMHAIAELQPVAAESWGVPVAAVLISPAFRFASYIGESAGVGCGGSGLASGQCARHPVVSYAPPADEEASTGNLEQMSRWFPKMIVTQPFEPDMLTRDPQVADRMNRDQLLWRQGYRARVLAELVREQFELADAIAERAEIFGHVPALILHGSGDRLFAVGGSHMIHSTWCDAAQASGKYPRLKIYDGAFHMLLNEPNWEEVINDIVQFIASKSIPHV